MVVSACGVAHGPAAAQKYVFKQIRPPSCAAPSQANSCDASVHVCTAACLVSVSKIQVGIKSNVHLNFDSKLANLDLQAHGTTIILYTSYCKLIVCPHQLIYISDIYLLINTEIQI